MIVDNAAWSANREAYGSSGVSGGGAATRACSIPEGDALFFPVINNFWNNTPDCGQGGVNYDVRQLIANIRPEIDSTRNLSTILDGKSLDKKQIQRVVSLPFASVFPADNVFGADACGTGKPLPAGIYSPSMDEGYYVLLPPLKVGPHTLHFHAESGTQANPLCRMSPTTSLWCRYRSSDGRDPLRGSLEDDVGRRNCEGIGSLATVQPAAYDQLVERNKATGMLRRCVTILCRSPLGSGD